jgi:RNA polymerase sigma factor (sigma-70 family)
MVKTARTRAIVDALRKAVQPPALGLTDGQLLGHYLNQRDETAFAALVRRDAFQAAFVVLARKGHRLGQQHTIGGWLHGVAYRVALNVRRQGAKRRAKEQQVEEMPHPLVPPEEDQRELLAVLDRELARLPEKYRQPVVLCELEGRSRKEAARQLGLAEGTLSSRLATARKKLAKRLAGRGAVVTGASLTALFASGARAAVVPGPLVLSTVRAAGGFVSASVVALAEGVMKAMFLAKIKGAAFVLLAAAFLGAGGVTLTYAAADGGQPLKTPAPTAAAKTDRDDLEALRLEVEALRAGLQATRERLKELQAEVRALKTAAPAADPGAGLPPDPFLTPAAPGAGLRLPPQLTPPIPTPSAAPTATEASPPPNLPVPEPAPAPPKTETVPGAAGALPEPRKPVGAAFVDADGDGRITAIHVPLTEAEERVREAADQLRKDPTNKQALDALIKAAKQLDRHREKQPPPPTPSQR